MRYRLVALLLSATALNAQQPPPVTLVTYSAAAHAFLDSMARDAFTHRQENAACVTAYLVSGQSLTLTALGPADYSQADSVSISTTNPGGVCPAGVPVIHSHIAFNGWPQPSDIDLATARQRRFWNLLLSVPDAGGWRLILY